MNCFKAVIGFPRHKNPCETSNFTLMHILYVYLQKYTTSSGLKAPSFSMGKTVLNLKYSKIFNEETKQKFVVPKLRLR
jgi:hypothetical protein